MFVGRCLVIMRTVAVNLTADFSAWPQRAVNIHIRRPGSDCRNQLINFTGSESLGPRWQGCRNVRTYVGCNDGSRYCSRWRRTRLSSCRTIAEIRAEEHGYFAICSDVAKVNVRLLNRSFEIPVGEFPVNSGFVVANTRIERSVASR